MSTAAHKFIASRFLISTFDILLYIVLTKTRIVLVTILFIHLVVDILLGVVVIAGSGSQN
jgi:hypothetical protein